MVDKWKGWLSMKKSFVSSYGREVYARSSSFLVSVAIHLLALLILSLIVFESSSNSIISLELLKSSNSVQVSQFDFEVDAEDNEMVDFELVVKQPEEIMDFVVSIEKHGKKDAESEARPLNQEWSGGDLSESAESQLDESPKPGESAKFFGTKAEGSSFVYILDQSFSMNKKGYWRTDLNLNFSRFDVARLELQNSIETLQPHQEFYVVLFSHKVKHFNPTAVKATNQNKRKFRRWIWDKEAKGLSDPCSSLNFAIKTNPSGIFLLGDGEFERGGPLFTIDDIRRQVEGITKIPIHTIALDDFRAMANMRELSALSGGQFDFIKLPREADEVEINLTVDQKYGLRMCEIARFTPPINRGLIFTNSEFDFISLVRTSLNQELSPLMKISLCRLILDFRSEVGGVTKNSRALLQTFFERLDRESGEEYQSFLPQEGNTIADCEERFQVIQKARQQRASDLEESMFQSWMDPFTDGRELVQLSDQLKIAKRIVSLYPETETADRVAKKYGLADSGFPGIFQNFGSQTH